jgi:hypothetical protein
MIRRSTWFLLVLLAALVAFYFYWNNRKAQQAAAATPTGSSAATSTPLFAAAEGAPNDLKVQDTTGKSVEVSRNGSGEWVLNAPTEAKADQAAAEAAVTQVTSLTVISSVQLGFDVVGLDKPAYTVTVKFSGGKSHNLKVGALTPIQDGYYSSLDGGPVRIVDKAGVDALVQLLAQPPYAATLTPTAPLESPTAPVELTSTPSGSTLTGTPATSAPAITDTPAAAPSETPTP